MGFLSGRFGEVGGLTAVEGEAVGEKVEADEECQDFGGQLWFCFGFYCELRAVCGEGFQGMGVSCEDEVTH